MHRRSYQSDDGWLLTYADLITNLLMFFVMLLAAAQLSRSRLQQISESLSGKPSPESLAAIQKKIDRQIDSEGLTELVRTDMTEEGLVLSLNSGLVFDSGSGDIRPELDETLDGVMRTLQPYSGNYKFAVEGHTDSRPLSAGARYASNWELSTARANAVRARMEQSGIEKDIRVEGYADTVALPEAVLAGLDEEDRLARHRRVNIRVY